MIKNKCFFCANYKKKKMDNGATAHLCSQNINVVVYGYLQDPIVADCLCFKKKQPNK